MKKHQIIATPHGLAKVLGFPMLRGFTLGVRFRVLASGEELNAAKFTVNKWQEEACREQD